eukprot:gene6681-6661_t
MTTDKTLPEFLSGAKFEVTQSKTVRCGSDGPAFSMSICSVEGQKFYYQFSVAASAVARMCDSGGHEVICDTVEDLCGPTGETPDALIARITPLCTAHLEDAIQTNAQRSSHNDSILISFIRGAVDGGRTEVSTDSLTVGTVVRTCGLTSATYRPRAAWGSSAGGLHEGRVGVVASGTNDRGRVGVAFPSLPFETVDPVGIKVEKLVAMTAAERELSDLLAKIVPTELCRAATGTIRDHNPVTYNGVSLPNREAPVPQGIGRGGVCREGNRFEKTAKHGIKWTSFTVEDNRVQVNFVATFVDRQMGYWLEGEQIVNYFALGMSTPAIDASWVEYLLDKIDAPTSPMHAAVADSPTHRPLPDKARRDCSP